MSRKLARPCLPVTAGFFPRVNSTHGVAGGPGRPEPPAPLPGPVSGLLFEINNVLYDTTLWRRWLLQLLARLGVQTHYRSFFHLWDHDYLDAVQRGQRTFCEAFREFLGTHGLSPGQIDELEAACRCRRYGLQAEIRPLPGVKPTLQRLRSLGYGLGVVTNSEFSAEVLRQRMRRFGLDEQFDVVVSSWDLRRTMPDAACYRTACEVLELSPEQIAFVGCDAPELDGAAAIGMATIRVGGDGPASADVRLDRFDAIVEAVETSVSLAAAG